MKAEMKDHLLKMVEELKLTADAPLPGLYKIREALAELISEAEGASKSPSYKYASGGIAFAGLSAGISVAVEDYHAERVILPYEVAERLQSRVRTIAESR